MKELITEVEYTTSIAGIAITITRYKGLKTYRRADGTELLAELAVYTDYGPKLGGGWSYLRHMDYTPEQCAEGKKQMEQRMSEIVADQGLW